MCARGEEVEGERAWMGGRKRKAEMEGGACESGGEGRNV